ncbi:MAG: glycosyltransferase [Gammaproteobacteria bacterium]|nr:glycosyltransferase [Gammaproteobacteria bacterium]
MNPVESPGEAGRGSRCRLLALAPNPWQGQWMNRQQILSRLAADHAVLYSTGAWSVWDRQAPGWRSAPLLGRYEPVDGVLVDHPPRALLRWPTRPRYDRAVLRLVQRRWLRQLATMGPGPLVAYLFHPRYLPFIADLPVDRVVYQPYDLFRRMPGWSPALARLEADLLTRSDAVIATSQTTRDTLQEQSPRPVHCVPNGVDASLFLGREPSAGDDPLAGIARPRIGYIGSVNRKVDLPLLVDLARREPSWQIVLVGPEGNFDEVTADALAGLAGLPNVHRLGGRDRRELPGLIGSLDVALMCYRAGTWMDSAYPLKLHEYLASGPPVVSSDLPSVRAFSAVVAIARKADDWHPLIRAALLTGGPGTRAARQEVAAANSWDRRVQDIRTILAGLAARA